jgi:predicted Fe-Mo cluster-binding NifX family protein
MKIAVPVTNNNYVDEHFGHCEFYSVFTISENNNISQINTIPSVQGCGCKLNIAGVLAADGVTMMLAGGIGGGAFNVLNNAGIDVVRGCSGDASEVDNLFISGLVTDSGESCHHHEAHHEEGSGHQCNHKKFYIPEELGVQKVFNRTFIHLIKLTLFPSNFSTR